MKILGIDAATDICGIALTEDRTLITEYRSNLKRAQNEKLIDSIDKVLADVKLTLAEVDAIAISNGPGSFTGLRIGLSAVKGLVAIHNIPVIAVNTLDALAHQALYWSYQICPLIKAQADEAYMALYQAEQFTLRRLTEYQLIQIQELPGVLQEKTLVLNIGLVNIEQHVAPAHSIVAPAELSLLSGLTIAQLGYDLFQQGKVANIDTLEPFYLKEFKVKLKKTL